MAIANIHTESRIVICKAEKSCRMKLQQMPNEHLLIISTMERKVDIACNFLFTAENRFTPAKERASKIRSKCAASTYTTNFQMYPIPTSQCMRTKASRQKIPTGRNFSRCCGISSSKSRILWFVTGLTGSAAMSATFPL